MTLAVLLFEPEAVVLSVECVCVRLQREGYTILDGDMTKFLSFEVSLYLFLLLLKITFLILLLAFWSVLGTFIFFRKSH